MTKRTKKTILENGACGCPIPWEHIRRIGEMVKEKYYFFSPGILDVEDVSIWLCLWERKKVRK